MRSAPILLCILATGCAGNLLPGATDVQFVDSPPKGCQKMGVISENAAPRDKTTEPRSHAAAEELWRRVTNKAVLMGANVVVGTREIGNELSFDAYQCPSKRP